MVSNMLGCLSFFLESEVRCQFLQMGLLWLDLNQLLHQMSAVSSMPLRVYYMSLLLIHICFLSPHEIVVENELKTNKIIMFSLRALKYQMTANKISKAVCSYHFDLIINGHCRFVWFEDQATGITTSGEEKMTK